jgi:hypothetical protein
MFSRHIAMQLQCDVRFVRKELKQMRKAITIPWMSPGLNNIGLMTQMNHGAEYSSTGNAIKESG